MPASPGDQQRDQMRQLALVATRALTWSHLVSYWVRTFPNHFEFVAVPGTEPFFTQIAFARVSHPLRSDAAKAFDAFFFGRARDVYRRKRSRSSSGSVSKPGRCVYRHCKSRGISVSGRTVPGNRSTFPEGAALHLRRLWRRLTSFVSPNARLDLVVTNNAGA